MRTIAGNFDGMTAAQAALFREHPAAISLIGMGRYLYTPEEREYLLLRAGASEVITLAEGELFPFLRDHPDRQVEKATDNGRSATLWRGYLLLGSVEHGQGNGARFGFPTANLAFDRRKELPKLGVYASWAEVDGREYPAVTNLGPKPSFDESGETTAETFLPGWEGDLYGKRMAVTLARYLRPIRVFYGGLEELKAQIDRDVEEMRELLKV